jgi:CHAD domain-containing protein
MKQAAQKSIVLDQGACIYGAGILLKHLQALEQEVAGVRAGHEDIEYIHRARVASRRLRAALPLFISCLPEKKAASWLKHIRAVTRALGEARDADVQLERLQKFLHALPDPRFRPGIQRLMLRLRQKRSRLQAPVTQAMAELQESGMLDQMRDRLLNLTSQADQVYMFTPALYQHSFSSVAQRLDAVLAYDEIVEQPDKVTELHEMRIAAKWLRYTLENFAPLYASQLKTYLSAVRKMQELLGDIHDSDLWLEFIPGFIAEERAQTLAYFGHERQMKRLLPGLHLFEDNRRAAREKLYEEFVTCWQNWKREDLWSELRAALQVPFPKHDDLYPPSRNAQPGE